MKIVNFILFQLFLTTMAIYEYTVQLRELSFKEKKLREKLRRRNLLDTVEILFSKGKPTEIGKTYLSIISPLALKLIKQHNFNILIPTVKIGIVYYDLIETITEEMLSAKNYDEFYIGAYNYIEYLTKYIRFFTEPE